MGADVQRFMDELALMDVPQPTAEQGGSSVLMMEQVATTHERLTKQRDWDAVAKTQLSKVFGAQTDATDEDLKRLVDNVYGLDGVEDVLGQDGAKAVLLYSQPISSLYVCVLTHPGASEMLRVEYEPSKANKPKLQQTAHGQFVRRRWVVPKATQEMTSANFDESAAAAAKAKKEGKDAPNMGCEVPFSRAADNARVQAAVDALEKDPAFLEASLEATSEDSEEMAAMKDSVSFARSAMSAMGPDNTMPCIIKAEVSFIGDHPFSTAVATPMDEPVKFSASDEPQKFWVQLGTLKEKMAIQVQLVRPTKGAAFRVDQCYISTPAAAED